MNEEKVDHLNGRIDSQEKQLREALGLRGEFIRNVNHEYHAPLTGIISSTAQTLWKSYDKLSDEQLRLGLKNIFKSSTRLKYFEANIRSLSRLSKKGYKLLLKEIDLNNLIYERLEVCQKLYNEKKEDREFLLDIAENITVKADEEYLMQVLDNLIINSITYCKQGKIFITLKRDEKEVQFTISDEGIVGTAYQ